MDNGDAILPVFNFTIMLITSHLKMFTCVHGSEREHFAITGAISGRFKAFSGRFLVQFLKVVKSKINYLKIFFCQLN